MTYDPADDYDAMAGSPSDSSGDYSEESGADD
jgi:hypothetical protein